MSLKEKFLSSNEPSPSVPHPVIYFDMDGVLADFYGYIQENNVLIRQPDENDNGWSAIIDWQRFKGNGPEENMYSKLSPLSDMVSYARELKDKGYDVRVLTGLPRGLPKTDENGNIEYRKDGVTPIYDHCESSREAKRQWLNKNGLEDIPMTGCFAYEKPKYITENCVLIDDKERNCKSFESAGRNKGMNAVAILYNNNFSETKEKVERFLANTKIKEQSKELNAERTER